MNESARSHTLVHRLTWDLRLVGLAMGGLFVALPFLVAHNGEAMGRGVSAMWVLGGLALIALFVLANTTMLTVDGTSATLRRTGLFGRRCETLPLTDIMQVDVMRISTSGSGTSYCVAVKLKGRRQTFMGESHAVQDEAEAEAALFRRLAGQGPGAAATGKTVPL